jgi:hypothetical protein
MTRLTSITTRLAALVTTLAFAITAAWAQGTSADLTSTDVGSVCPGARDELPEALARTAQEHRTPASVAVQFQVQGSRVMAVQTQGGAASQQRAVRRAVQGLACSSTSLQTVRLNLRFTDPRGVPAAPLLAAASDLETSLAGSVTVSTLAPNPR